ICTFRFPECGLPDFAVVSETPTRVQMCTADGAGTARFGLVTAAIGGFAGSVTLSANGVPAGASAAFSPSPTATAPAYTQLTLSGLDAVASGEYAVEVIGTSGGDDRSLALDLGVSSDVPAGPVLPLPADGATGVHVRP